MNIGVSETVLGMGRRDGMGRGECQDNGDYGEDEYDQK